MPRKIRKLIQDLTRAGFIDKGGKGSHRNFIHPNCKRPITLSGKPGDDAKKYQERDVKGKIEESKS
jgi:predicted RNA binding protein YcfA (HicA-like mRNA interferase family)